MAFTTNHTQTSFIIPGPSDLLRTFSKWMKRRQKHNEIAKMLELEDWVLKDMGVTRGDLREALAFKGNSSLHLRALAARRRFWSRSSARH